MAQDFRRGAGPGRGTRIGAAFAVLLMLGAGAPVRADEAGPAIIGVAAPLTGDSSAEGPELRSGVVLGMASLEGGGVLGRRLQLEIVDDACEAAGAATAARHLVEMQAVLIIGHVCSDATLAAAPIYAAADILQITPASTNPEVTEQGIATLFRTIGRDDHQGEAAAALIAARWPAARLAILDDGQSYGNGLAEALAAALGRRHVPIILRQHYDRHGGDVARMVAAIKSERADLVYLSGDELHAAILARACRAAGIEAQFLGGDALVNPRFRMAAAEAAEGTIFSFPPDLAQLPEAAPALARFKAAGIEPDGYALLAYAAVQVWAQAATDAGSFEAGAVARSLRARSFKTAIGALRFDAKGDIEGRSAEFVWYRWQNGKPEPLADLPGAAGR